MLLKFMAWLEGTPLFRRASPILVPFNFDQYSALNPFFSAPLLNPAIAPKRPATAVGGGNGKETEDVVV